MTPRERFNSEYPGVFFLEVDDLSGIERYLTSLAWIDSGEHVGSAQRAGSGNMNATVRVTTDRRQFILKQSRPWVEKYPSISAPFDRTLVEGAFYEWARSHPDLYTFMPQMFGFDNNARVLMLEDLGTAGDFSSVYRSGQLDDVSLTSLLQFLRELRSAAAPSKELFANRDMRRLNHEHIFNFPLRADNGLDLDAITPGLKNAAGILIGDDAYCSAVARLGGVYLSDGPTLVHGDYFPGSWLRSSTGVKVVDPEFCFLGAAEFDAGCMLAHLLLARQPPELIERTLDEFKHADLDIALVNRFAGTEIMRRIIGVAQLPIEYGIEAKRELLDRSRRMVLAATYD